MKTEKNKISNKKKNTNKLTKQEKADCKIIHPLPDGGWINEFTREKFLQMRANIMFTMFDDVNV